MQQKIPFLLYFMGSILLSACAPPSKKFAGRDPKKTVTLHLKNTPETLDPIRMTSETSALIGTLIYARLYRQVLDRGKPVIQPYAVSSEKPDLCGATLRLRSLPSAVTSYDFEKSLQRLKRSGRFAYLTEKILTVKALSSEKLRVNMKCVSSRKQMMARWELQKLYFSMPQMSAGRPDFYTGEFREVRLLEEETVLESAKLRLVFRALPSPSGAWFYFRRGLLDVYQPTGIYRLMPATSGYQKIEKPGLVVLYGAVVPSTEKNDVLNRIEFRQALNRAFDRKTVAENVLLGSIAPADYPVPPILAKPPKEKYEHAEDAMLKESFSTAKRIHIFTPPDPERQKIARILYYLLREARLPVKVQVIEMAALLAMNNRRVRGIYLLKWVADYPHAENFLVPLFHSANVGPGGNRAWLKDSRLDRILEQVSQDPGASSQAQRMIQRLAPWVFIGFSKDSLYIRNGVTFRPPLTYSGYSERIFY